MEASFSPIEALLSPTILLYPENRNPLGVSILIRHFFKCVVPAMGLCQQFIRRKVEKMSDTLQIVLGFIALIAIFAFSRFAVLWQTSFACKAIIRDLESRQAFDPNSAADLPYGKVNVFRVGLRDFRPKALESLVQSGIVVKTEMGNYYLQEKSPEEAILG
jgi:hypothetical protein